MQNADNRRGTYLIVNLGIMYPFFFIQPRMIYLKIKKSQ